LHFCRVGIGFRTLFKHGIRAVLDYSNLAQSFSTIPPTSITPRCHETVKSLALTSKFGALYSFGVAEKYFSPVLGYRPSPKVNLPLAFALSQTMAAACFEKSV